jgi:hypothetical protein
MAFDPRSTRVGDPRGHQRMFAEPISYRQPGV